MTDRESLTASAESTHDVCDESVGYVTVIWVGYYYFGCFLGFAGGVVVGWAFL